MTDETDGWSRERHAGARELHIILTLLTYIDDIYTTVTYYRTADAKCLVLLRPLASSWGFDGVG